MKCYKAILMIALLMPAPAFAQQPDNPEGGADESMGDGQLTDESGMQGGGDIFLMSPPGNALLTGDLQQSAVTNRQGEDIGNVEDVLITREGRVSAVVVSVGGFLGIAQKNVAIAWNQVVLQRGEQGEGYIVQINVNRGSLENAPEFDTDSLDGGDADLGS